MMTHDENLAIEIEDILRDMIINNSNLEAEEGDEMISELDNIRTFSEAGLLTRDRGLVLRFNNAEVNITIQAYSERN